MAGDSPSDDVHVAVIFGGQSGEHSVSCLTAAGVLSALDANRFVVHGIGIDPGGVWHRYSRDEIRQLRVVGRELPSIGRDHPRAILTRDASRVTLATMDGDRLIDPEPVDVAFPLLHGAYGEDGTIQGVLEMLGLPYVGAGVAASAICMDKYLTKLVLGAAGLSVGRYLLVESRSWAQDRDACLAELSELALPVYVKPARGGSSLGISRVSERSGLPAAVELAQRYDPRVIVEQAFGGAREIECAVMGDRNGGAPRTSRPGEIVMHTSDGFYDFEAKYLPDERVTLQVPADLPAETARRVRETASAAFGAVGAEGLARVDMFVGPGEAVWVNEINTMPGFTAHSMYPWMWRESGLSYPDLVVELIELAMLRPNSVLR
jgi:D-alanine-D-alanine ligase